MRRAVDNLEPELVAELMREQRQIARCGPLLRRSVHQMSTSRGWSFNAYRWKTESA